MENLSHQAKFTNQSWSFQVSHMEEDHHQNIVMNSPPWTSTFPLHSLPILPPSHNSSTQMALLSIPAPPDEAELHAAEEPEEELGAMKEMMYKIAAMQPVDIDPATIRKPKRRNVRISDDPQSVAARHRRERISEKIRILQRLVPGGTKMDTASMLDEAIRYVKFLRRQIRLLQSSNPPDNSLHLPPPVPATLPSKQSPLISINNSSKNNSNSLICFNQPHEEIRE